MIDDNDLLRAEPSTDDLHPNAAGDALMGPLAEAAIGQGAPVKALARNVHAVPSHVRAARQRPALGACEHGA